MPTPILLISDAIDQPTGLARISRDLLGLLHANRQVLDIEVAQLGWGYREEQSFPWPVRAMRDRDEWGAADLPKCWWSLYGNRRGVVLTVWDPGRCFSLSATAADSPVQLWGYFPVDSTGINGALSGPPLVALQRYRRVLAYGPWGSSVLRKTLDKPVAWLPHGIDLEVFKPITPDLREVPAGSCKVEDESQYSTQLVAWYTGHLVGCVAANQPRKDYGLLFHAWKIMGERDPALRFWLHTDDPVRHWSVPQLVEDFGLQDRIVVTTPESVRRDGDLAALYAQCIVTIGCGLGEGFGYSAVESLACGAPQILIDYAGGAGLVPVQAWRVEPRSWRIEGAFAQLRPVCEPYEVATAALQAIAWRRKEPEVVSAWCRGAVEAFSWKHLGGYWLSWVARGLQELRES